MDREPSFSKLFARSAHRAPTSDDPRLARLREDVVTRLRPACAGLPREAFDELVAEICATKLRWDPHALVRWQR